MPHGVHARCRMMPHGVNAAVVLVVFWCVHARCRMVFTLDAAWCSVYSVVDQGHLLAESGRLNVKST
ncbi:hypothetical protein J6590_056734 [Homalodisca vitripennis]|nr:hypothetical protein J6590_056734 [Homalodisca vitripennis]